MSDGDLNGIAGRSENAKLEFKAREILKAPAKVAREVVAFLNGKGGDLWIGYPEQNGVAGHPESIPEPDREIGILQNHLIDTIEPPVQIPGDVDLRVRHGQILLRVKRGKNGPYAHRDGGRRYLIRVGDRLREMSREEIAAVFRSQAKVDDSLGKVFSGIRNEQRKAAAKAPSLWLQITPSEPLSIDFDGDETREQFREWLMDATKTGNRRTGWNFANNLSEPKFLSSRVSHGPEPYQKTEIHNTGQVTFTATRDRLYHKGNDSDPRDLYPYTLIEFPVSIFRLAAAVLGRYNRESDLEVAAGFVISGIRGWRLRPGSPRGILPPWSGPKEFERDVLEIDPEKLVFDADKLGENPDRCGLKLIRLVYEEFGFESSEIPREFDQREGVLHLD